MCHNVYARQLQIRGMLELGLSNYMVVHMFVENNTSENISNRVMFDQGSVPFPTLTYHHCPSLTIEKVDLLTCILSFNQFDNILSGLRWITRLVDYEILILDR